MFAATPRFVAIALSTVFVVLLLGILLAGNVRASGGPTYVWGDLNCDESVDPVDGLLILRHDAGLSANTGACPDIGATLDLTVAAVLTWGDLDCSSLVDPIDALKTLRHDAALGYTKEDANCPDAGDTVTAGTSETPTPTSTATVVVTPSATATPTETPTATPTPQASPTPTPTLAPFPDQCPSYTDPPSAIADNGGPQRIITSGNNLSEVTKVTVCLEVDHTYIGDIKVWLKHGTTIVVLQENIEDPDNPGPGNCAGNNMFVIYNDNASDPVQDSCEPTQDPALFGYYSPKDALSVFNGIDAGSADWELWIEDTRPGDTGVIVSYQLTIEGFD